MKTLVNIILLLSVISLSARSQNSEKSFTVKGTVADSLSKEGEPYATLKITKKETPQETLRMAVTDAKGGFSESVKGTGDFTLTVSSMGRSSIVKDFTVKDGERTVDLGTLLIHDAQNELSGVEVVTQKPLVKADIDKIEYDIENDPESKTNSVMEMLRKVPMVTVDGQDNIKVNGSTSFKVFVNGKPNNMMTNNPKDVLKSMPANSIKRIEVITNPGPKYDAEGVGGILNIITVGSGVEGYTATFNARAHDKGYGGGAFATVKKNKLTVSANYNYVRYDQPRQYGGSSMTATGETASSGTANTASGSGTVFDSNFHSGSLEASYEIDTLRLVTASFNVWGGGYTSDGDSWAEGVSPADGSQLYKYSTLYNSKNTWYSIDGGIDYQRLFKVKDRMLTISYKINTNPESGDSYNNYGDMQAAEDWLDFIQRMKSLHQESTQNSTEQTFQVDYTTPIGKMHTVEGGVKYILRDNRSEDDRYEQLSADSPDYTFDNDQSSHYKHENDILAAYLGYGIKAGRFSGRLGLRYEHTIQDVKYELGRGDDFRKHFNDAVPSASIGYKLTDMQNLRLGYNMRIYRPGIYYLNPYLNDSDPTSLSQGNPNLDSEKSHSISLSYSNFTSNFSLNLSAVYRFTNNSIESVTSLVNDNTIAGLQNPTGKDVIYNTYRNIGKSRAAGMNAYVNWNMTSSTRIYANLNGNWMYITDGMTLSNRGWSFNGFGGVQQTLPKDWTINLSYYLQTPWQSLQGNSGRFTDYAIYVTKSFMKKRLTVSVLAGNFFTKYTKYDNTIESQGFTKKSWGKACTRRFGIDISYRIGELKSSVKKAERTISNDDVKGGGGNAQGGGGGK